MGSFTGGRNASGPQTNREKNDNRSAALGRPAMKLLWGFNWFAVDQPSALAQPRFLRNLVFRFAWEIILALSYGKGNQIHPV